MQNLTIQLGSVHLRSFSGRPTRARHCAAAHLSAPPSLFLAGNTRGARRSRAPRSGRCRAPPTGRGQAPLHCLAPRGAPAAGTPLSFFPLSRATNRARSTKQPTCHSSALPSPTPLWPPSPLFSAPIPPPPATGGHSFTRIPAKRRHRPPFPGELLPELPILAISYNFLTPLTLPSRRASLRSTTTTGAPSPPVNAAVPELSSRLAVDPPFRCAPSLSSLLGTFPVAPSRSPATPCRRRATAEPPVSTPLRHPTRGLCVVTAPARTRCSGPRRPFTPPSWAARPWPSQLFGRPRVAGCHAPWAVASGRFQPSTVPRI
jgi:hypothetical protein